MAAKKREIYHVLWERNHWTIKKEKSRTGNGKFQNKEEALQKGRSIARSKRLGQLIVHKKDGKVQTEFTYKKDPHPPKG